VSVVALTSVGDSPAGTSTVTPWPASAPVSTGVDHSCLISGGQGFCWGDNGRGELGDGSAAGSRVPVPVSSGVLAGKTLAQVSAGFDFTCGVDSAGAVYCWGSNDAGQLGDGEPGTDSAVPVAVATAGTPMAGKTIVAVSAGYRFACALDSAGAVYCWGDNRLGELGDDNAGTGSAVPVAVATAGTPMAGKAIVAVSAGYRFACALDSTGAVSCWGDNTAGQLGNNDLGTSSAVPVAVATAGTPMAGQTIVGITTGKPFACALDSAGAAYCWGGGGDLGNGSLDNSPVPVAVSASGVLSGKTLVQIAAGAGFACALDATGIAYCWGNNDAGQLGDDNAGTSSLMPVPVYTPGTPLAGKTVTRVVGGGGGGESACAMDSAGTAYCWGNDSAGQLGNDSTTNSGLPVLVGPQAPAGVTGQPGDARARVSWTAPGFLNNGRIVGYTVSASPGNSTCATSTATGCTLTGLADGTTYAVTVTATATTGSAPGIAVAVEPAGFLTISVPPSATLPATTDGHNTSGQLGRVTVTDNRALASTAWTATVSSTSFVTGTGGAGRTIGNSDVSYWSGPALITSGRGRFTPGQATAADAVNLSAARDAFSLSAGSGVNSVSWNPTLSVSVPTSVAAGTYTATITQSAA
jgi:alpha-tubulin suppressor-like RCC1 family protein